MSWRKISTSSEAVDAWCSDCCWTTPRSTSRTIRKSANRHAAKQGHRVNIEYETTVTVDARPTPQEDR